ncbi:hypothetical protein ARAF_2643 [Arsenophonus endosymbiont of Aleurodicus floccissimus]|uniref:hypothetical protein n=1 Tax=Arsenophonus endosymbiont of Aleurodicus floccissimus TaxID=2152761 RepID=UPI000E6B0C09|nr:hypothetical protein [Arsenophonus endosymbiont of Aleurodicus floccissimus]SPP32478.1 hypothetical protein ARAF_2643 [Arsenophonus endosymbiont of Aleurodicus floccissimus]
MNSIEFIENHVVTELVKQGYEQSVARISADVAVEHYRRHAASAKEKIFSDCLHIAKAWARKYQPQIKK